VLIPGFDGGKHGPHGAGEGCPKPIPAKTLRGDVIEVANGYRKSATLRALAHNIVAEKYERRNKYLGVPAAGIAAVVGSSIFASLSSNDKNIYLMVATGGLSILACILSAMDVAPNVVGRRR
jgi:hypothetical protein